MKMFNLAWPIQSRLSTTHPYLIRANISAPVASIVLRMNITQKVSLTMRKTTMRKYPKGSVYWAVNTTKSSSSYLREPMLWRMYNLSKDYSMEMLSQIRISKGWFESIGRQPNNEYSNSWVPSNRYLMEKQKLKTNLTININYLMNSHKNSSRNWTTSLKISYFPKRKQKFLSKWLIKVRSWI